MNKITIKFGTELNPTKHIIVNYNFTEIIFNLHPPIPEVCSIKLLNSWSLAFFSGHRFYSNLRFDTTCWVPNNIITNISKKKKKKTTTQEHIIYVENPFSLKGKMKGQTPNNFVIIKSITIILVYVSRLKKKSLLFSLLSHTLIIFLKGGNTLFSPFIFFSTHNSLSWLSSFSKQLTFGCSLSLFLLCGIFFFFLHYAALFFNLCVFFFLAHACLLYTKETLAALHS